MTTPRTIEESQQLFDSHINRLHAECQRILTRRFEEEQLDGMTDAGYWRLMARMLHHNLVSLYQLKPLTSDEIMELLGFDDVFVDEFHDVCWREEK